MISNPYGSLIHYSELYDKAIRKANTLRPKQELGIPEMVKRALMEDGWICRQTIVWFKRNPMPESVTDRTTKAHEMVFLLAKNERYFYDGEAIKEPAIRAGDTPRGGKKTDATRNDGDRSTRAMCLMPVADNRNARSVWDIPTVSYKGSHFATMPPKLAERCILAGTSEKGCCAECGTPWERIVEKTSVTPKDYEGKNLATDKQGGARRMLANVRARREAGEPHDNPFPPKKTLGWRQACTCLSHAVRPCIVLDPFAGSGTTLSVADGLHRDSVGLDISDDYLTMARRRIERPHAAPIRIKAESMPLFGE